MYKRQVLEFSDQAEEKSFLLGMVIETGASNNYQTYRYVADRKMMEEMEHTYEKDGRILPYSAAALQKRYKLTLLNREQGLPRFMQMTGLKPVSYTHLVANVGKGGTKKFAEMGW